MHSTPFQTHLGTGLWYRPIRPRPPVASTSLVTITAGASTTNDYLTFVTPALLSLSVSVLPGRPVRDID